jgi:hypothetical protein
MVKLIPKVNYDNNLNTESITFWNKYYNIMYVKNKMNGVKNFYVPKLIHKTCMQRLKDLGLVSIH